jgi:hypothetical protein
MKKYGRRLAIESAYKKPDGVLSYVPRKDSIINFGFSGTDITIITVLLSCIKIF